MKQLHTLASILQAPFPFGHAYPVILFSLFLLLVANPVLGQGDRALDPGVEASLEADQEVLWADELVKFSTEYGRGGYSARQVLGPPNKLPASGASPCAWAPSREDNRAPEFVRVRFAKALRVRQIAVAENLNPGAIARIELYDLGGKKHVVYENDATPSFHPEARMFRHFMPQGPFITSELRLVLATDRVQGMHQIDAIAISDGTDPIQPQIRRVEYEDYDTQPENLGPAINSMFDDMLPIISPDGQTLYFARKLAWSNTGPELRDDIYVSERQTDGTWGEARNIGSPLNNEHHNFVCGISPDGRRMLVPHDYKTLGVGFRVSQSLRTGDGWSFPRTLRFNNLYSRNEFAAVHWNNYGNVILFAIEREDTEGDMDLYVSRLRENGTWSEPINLGTDVNTPAREGSVFLAADGRTIYFSSEGYAGYGGFDMYMSKRLDDTWTKWSEPYNLGPSVNTNEDDYYYTIPASGDYVYYSSKRSEYGGADIYRLPLPAEVRPEPVALIGGSAVDALSNLPVDARIELRVPDAPLEGLRPGEETAETARDYQFVVPAGSEFTLTIEADGYFPVARQRPPPLPDDAWMDFDETDSIEFVRRELVEILRPEVERELGLKESTAPLPDSAYGSSAIMDSLAPLVRSDLVEQLTAEAEAEAQYREVYDDIDLVPLEAGMVVRLDHIYFPANKSYLRKESTEELHRVAAFLRDHPGLVVEIGGHTNGLPSRVFCEELSTARAKRVFEFLIESGVDKGQLRFAGYGKTKPVASNESVTGRQKNQRVELTILEVR